MTFFSELKKRSALLYWFGLFNLTVAAVCLFLMPFEDVQILGVNRWLKPFKFYASVGIVILTFGWLMYYLENKMFVRICSWIMVLTMLFENGIIMYQAIRKTSSHFNITSDYNGQLFKIMGMLIGVFTIIVAIVCIQFFRQKKFNITPAYVWGIRLGITCFLIFSMEGGLMVSLMKHTVGGEDGGPGLPLVNWSTQYGDLRVAHFIGLHALQVLPLFGHYIAKTKTQSIFFSLAYFILGMALFLQAMKGIPLFF